ncbi:PQQ-binding-like beta-propeller repeat protein [Crassaminicella indica]|uniref:PQQ-binding-like beta-propeller repeat protein n=1 Tax=Crassaminicella indica TaxID=2855394 RepID=A0ABX8R898_9CLOT|nr:PQQ-binding-like beta-propeller repeat protein [Crassaminicella indica]QXM05258.1 PQQ-binding-like beta-propeller repeat protein [Crassaminicella indica]
MKKNKKIFSIFLTLVIIFTIFFSSFASGIYIEPIKRNYTGGEKIDLTADLYDGEKKVTSGIDWYYFDNDKKKHIITGDSDNIEFIVPNNMIDKTVSTVVYAVYNGNSQKISIDIAPQAPVASEPLKLVEVSPVKGVSGIKTNREISLTFNKAVVLNEECGGSPKVIVRYDKEKDGILDDFYPNGLVCMGMKKHKLLFSEDKPEKVVIQLCDKAGNPIELEKDHKYEIAISGNWIKAKNSDEKFEGIGMKKRGEWIFDTKQTCESLKLLSKIPVNGAKKVKKDAEIALIFNQPVEIGKGFENFMPPKVTLYYDADSVNKPDTKYNPNIFNQLIFDKENPEKVIIKIKKNKREEKLLEENHVYALEVAKGCIQAKNTGEKFEGIKKGEWIFDTKQNDIDIIVERFYIYKGEAIKLKVEKNDKKIIWKSSDPKIAKIDENGVLTGLTKGKVEIEAFVEGEEDKKGSVEMTVLEYKPKTIYIYRQDKDYRMNAGESKKLYIQAVSENGQVIKDYKLVKWYSSNTDILTVDKNGLVEAKKGGYSTVHAEVLANSQVKATKIIEVRDKVLKQLVPQWRYILDKGYQRKGHPVVSSDGSVYILLNRRILAINSNGTKKETFKNIIQIDSEPIGIEKIDGKEYLLATNESELLLINPQTGNVEWKAKLKDRIVSKPAVDSKNGNIYVLCCDDTNDHRTVYAINKNSEKYLWRYDVGSWHSSEDVKGISIDEKGNIFIVTGNKIWIFNKAGKFLWNFKNPNNREFKSLVTIGENNTAYIIDSNYNRSDNILFSLDIDQRREKWRKKFDDIKSKRPLIDKNGNLYICAQHEGKYNLLQLNPQTGDVDAKYDPCGAYALIGENGYLYSSENVFDKDHNILSYYYEKVGNKPHPEFELGRNGLIYRTLEGEYDFEIGAIEAVKLCDATDTKISGLRVLNKLPIDMFVGDEMKIAAGAVNKNGAFIKGVELEWQSENTDVATAVYGKITAKKVGTANISIKVKDKEIRKSIEVKVKKAPIPKKMYFVYSNLVEHPKKIEKITGYCGESLPSAYIFIEDQYGNFMTKQPVTWSVSKQGIIGYKLYDTGSGVHEIKYQAVLSAQKAGETMLKASLDSNPNIYCEIPITIKSKRSDTIWEHKIEYDQSEKNKNCYHVMGKKNEIYYTTKNKLAAISKENGKKLWESEIKGEFGAPQVSEDGDIYIFANEKVYRVNHEDGKMLEKFNTSSKVKNLIIADDCIYVLNNENKLYKLDNQLNKIWKTPLNVGENYGLLLVNNKLYISKEDKIYNITEDAHMKLVYEDEHTELWLEASTKDGDLIIQKNNLGNYSLISINNEGKENWKYEKLKGKVGVGCDENSNVYAVEINTEAEKEIYYLDQNGKEKVKTTFVDTNDSCFDGVYKVVVGKDGTVYITTTKINAFSPKGECLWQKTLFGAFTIYIPQSITVDDNGIVYIGAGRRGVLALKGREQTGVQVSIKGKETVALNTFKDLEVELINHEEGKDIDLKITLEDIDAKKALSETHFEDEIKADTTNIYKFGVKIPKEGNLKVKLEIFDRKDKKLICQDEINL